MRSKVKVKGHRMQKYTHTTLGCELSIRQTNRLIHDVNHPERDLLYDVGSDPGELASIANDVPNVLQRMQALAQEYLLLEPPWEGGAPEVELDELHLRQLRAL